MVSPFARAARSLDRWLIREHRTRLTPLYSALAKKCQQGYRQAGIPGVLRVFDEGMRPIQDAQATVLLLSVRAATALAWRVFALTLVRQYGAERIRQRLMLQAATDQDTELASILDTLLPRFPESILDIPLGTGAPQQVLEAFLHYRDQYGLNYSERIWKNDAQTRQALNQALIEHLTSGRGVLHDVNNLTVFQVEDQALPAYLQQLERHARTALSGDPAAKAQFLEQLNRLKAHLETLTSGPLGTQGMTRRLLQRLSKAVQQGNAALVDAAIEKYVARQGAYRSSVLLRTEGVRAYQLASIEMYQEQSFVHAMKWNLSGAHAQEDECDLRARANIGLGPGVYYLGRVPWPGHAQCRCHVTPVLSSPEELDTAQQWQPDDPAAYDAFITELQGPLAKRANSLGRKGNTEGLQQLIDAIPQIQKSAAQ